MSLDYTGIGELIDDYCGSGLADDLKQDDDLKQADDTIDVLANEIRTLREQNQRMSTTIHRLRGALAEVELIMRGAGAGK